VSVFIEQVQALGLGYKFIKGSLLPGTAASNSAVIVLGKGGNYEPIASTNATSVAQKLNF
jgi:hypothetical protein